MLLSTLYWPDEVRDVGELELPADDADFKPAELAMAAPARRGDDAASSIPAATATSTARPSWPIIEAKVAGEPVEIAEPPTPAASKLTDLMAVLEASVAAARSQADATPEKAKGRTSSRAAASPDASVRGSPAHTRCGCRREGPGRAADTTPQDRLRRPWTSAPGMTAGSWR